MKNTKESILEQLLLLQNTTISQLSEILAISEISVRHHLMSLEAEGIITSSEERHGVGRPRFVYHLTEKGFQNVPTNYIKLSDQALTTMEHFLGTDKLLELFKQIGRDLAETVASSVSSQDPEEKLEQFASHLTQDGFIFPGPGPVKNTRLRRITALSITLDKTTPKFVQSTTLC